MTIKSLYRHKPTGNIFFIETDEAGQVLSPMVYCLGTILPLKSWTMPLEIKDSKNSFTFIVTGL